MEGSFHRWRRYLALGAKPSNARIIKRSFIITYNRYSYYYYLLYYNGIIPNSILIVNIYEMGIYSE